jgi:hypothetical protein
MKGAEKSAPFAYLSERSIKIAEDLPFPIYTLRLKQASDSTGEKLRVILMGQGDITTRQLGSYLKIRKEVPMFAKFKLLPLVFLSLLGYGVAHASPAPAPADPGQGSGQTIRCSSDDGKRHYCNMDSRGGVRLSRQISGSACIQNQTWGYDNRGVWVDRGCRAEFTSGGGNRPGYGGGGGNNWGGNNNNNRYRTFTCSSNDGRRNYCSLPGGSNQNGVIMSRQISGSACIQNQTWGVDRRGVWVDRGCRAEFRARY